jgi:hypothetical protein
MAVAMLLQTRAASHSLIEKGALFCRSRGWTVVETVRIIAVSRDAQGIPHVRYEVQAGRGSRPEDQRTLSLESFRRLYPDPAAA